MKDLKRQLEIIVECLPESPFRETVKKVTSAAIAEIDRWRSQVEITAEQQCPICCKSSPDDIKRIRKMQEALRQIVEEGDYTAPEGMKRIAKKALEESV